SLSLCLCDEPFLDAATDGEQSAVSAVASDNHQTDRRGTRWLYRQTQPATIEKIDDRRIAQQFEVEPRVILIAGERRHRWGGHWHGRHDQSVEGFGLGIKEAEGVGV